MNVLRAIVIAILALPIPSASAANPCGDGDSGDTWSGAQTIPRGVACPDNSVNDADPDWNDKYKTPALAPLGDSITVKVCVEPGAGGGGELWAWLGWRNLHGVLNNYNPNFRDSEIIAVPGCTTLSASNGLTTITQGGEWGISISHFGWGRLRYSLCLDAAANGPCNVA